MRSCEVQYRDSSKLWANLYDWELGPDSELFRVIVDGDVRGYYSNRGAAEAVRNILRAGLPIRVNGN